MQRSPELPATGPERPRRPSREVVEAVQASCAAVADRPARLAEEFYAQLFAMAPELRSAFPADLTDQMQKMTDTLLLAIRRLVDSDTDELEVALRRLGAAHRTRYGVQTAHYGYIGHALTRAVREVAGPRFSGSLSSSWIAVYQWVAGHMIAGADAVDAPAAPPAFAARPAPSIVTPSAPPSAPPAAPPTWPPAASRPRDPSESVPAALRR